MAGENEGHARAARVDKEAITSFIPLSPGGFGDRALWPPKFKACNFCLFVLTHK